MMRTAVDEKMYMVFVAMETICSDKRYYNTYIRRWGNGRPVFKTHKIALILKRRDPLLFNQLFNYFNCKDDDHRCMGLALYRFLFTMFKTLMNEIYTIGDLCGHIYPRIRDKVIG